MALIPLLHHHNQPIPSIRLQPNCNNNAPHTLSLNNQILQACLAWFTDPNQNLHQLQTPQQLQLQHQYQNDPDLDTILDTSLRSNPDLLEPALHSPLREREFRAAFYMVIDAIEDSEAEAAEIFGGAAAESAVMVGALKALLAELEDEWEGGLEDFGVVGAVGVGGRSGRKRAQRVFRALAEVSHATGSRMLGSVLRTFFLGWLYELAEEEDAVALAGRCWGIARAWMDPKEKEESLRALVALRPDVLADLSGRAAAAGPEWVPLPLSLGGGGSSSGAVVDWPRRRRAAERRAAERRWWDDENDQRIRRMVEDSGYFGRGVANRDRCMVSLWLGDDSPYYRRHSGRTRLVRSSRSLDSALRRSRTPWLRYDGDATRRLRYADDFDQDDGCLSTGQRLLDNRPDHARGQRLRREAKQALAQQWLNDRLNGRVD